MKREFSSPEAFILKGEKIILASPYLLSEDDWKLIASAFNRIGYGIPNASVAEECYGRLVTENKKAGGLGYILQPDQAREIRALLGNQRSLDPYQEYDMDASVAENYFGTTSIFEYAGYLTVNGKLLDFSAGCGSRVIDHREIHDAYPDIDFSQHGDDMIAFMQKGNIRMTAHGFDLAVEPNDTQINVIRDFVCYKNGEIAVDYSYQETTVGSAMYRPGTCSSRIISDIKGFFETGFVLPGTA